MSYIEKVKLRFLDGNLNKPEELYEDLIADMQKEKEKHVIPWLKENVRGDTIADIGGGNGYLIKDLDFNRKVVMDKRKFGQFDDITYYRGDILYDFGIYSFMNDCVVLSEVLHLFSNDMIWDIIYRLHPKRLIIIENTYDDFLDLRLRMWTSGKCIDSTFISNMVNCVPRTVGNHLIWDVVS